MLSWAVRAVPRCSSLSWESVPLDKSMTKPLPPRLPWGAVTLLNPQPGHRQLFPGISTHFSVKIPAVVFLIPLYKSPKEYISPFLFPCNSNNDQKKNTSGCMFSSNSPTCWWQLTQNLFSPTPSHLSSSHWLFPIALASNPTVWLKAF